MKQKLFIDFDGVLVDSVKAFCKAYNSLYISHNGFEPAEHSLVNKWDFSDQCPLIHEPNNMYPNVEGIFAHQLFWNELEPMENAKNALLSLASYFELIVVSIGSAENLAKKSLYIKEHFPMIHDVILIRNSDIRMDKSIIDMKGGILIDDNSNNLVSSNADIKICFGKDAEWNTKHGRWLNRCMNWVDVLKWSRRHIKDKQKSDMSERVDSDIYIQLQMNNLIQKTEERRTFKKEKFIQEILLKLRNYIKDNRISLVELSNKTKIKKDKLNRILYGDDKLKMKHYALICETLGLEFVPVPW